MLSSGIKNIIMFRLEKYFIVILWSAIVVGHPKNLAWKGGPMHLECEHKMELLTRSGQHVKDNVIIVKAVTFKDEIYVIAPRFKRGVLATVLQLVRGRQGVEFLPYPDLNIHTTNDCKGIHNAIDIFLDHFGNLWVLDSGVVETLESPRCMCPPKVVTISLLLGKITKYIDLSSLTVPTSTLQNVVIEYGIGSKPFIYVSDAARGAILVHDVTSGSEWMVLACPPGPGLQITLMKYGPTYSALILIRLHQQGLLELNTAALRRKNSASPLQVLGENTKPVVLLGSDSRHVYLRHVECSDVLSWDTREAYNTSVVNIHSPGPRLTSTSVAADPFKQVIMVLDSNYGDTMRVNTPTYHRITFIGQV